LPFKQRLDALMAGVARTRTLRALSTPALMSILVQGVGFYFASAPLLQRIGAAEEISQSHLDDQVTLFAEFVLAGLLPGSTA
jgi:hypothetical protein